MLFETSIDYFDSKYSAQSVLLVALGEGTTSKSKLNEMKS